MRFLPVPTDRNFMYNHHGVALSELIMDGLMRMENFQARDEGRQEFGKHFKIDAFYFYFYCCATFMSVVFTPTYLFCSFNSIAQYRYQFSVVEIDRNLTSFTQRPSKEPGDGGVEETKTHMRTLSRTRHPKKITTRSCIFFGLGSK